MIFQESNNELLSLLVCLILGVTSFNSIGQLEVNHVKTYGETVNKSYYIDNFIKIKKGDFVSMEDLEKTRTNLVQLPKYGHVHLKVDTIPENKINVTYELYEVKTVYPLINLGAIEGNRFFQLGVGNSSAFGVGLVYNAYYRNTDNRHNFQVNMFKPFIKNLPIGIGVVASRDATLEPVYFGEQASNFYYTKLNTGLELKYYFTPRNILTFSSSYFSEDYEQLNDEVISIDDFTHRKSLYALEFKHDMRNYFYYYLEGGVIETKVLQVVNYDFEGDFRLAQIMYKGFKRFGKRHNLGVRVQAGVATNSDSPFVLDSYLNIRGSGNRQERGTGSVISNFEWRWSFFEKKSLAAQAVLFSDLGTWRLPGEILNFEKLGGEFRAFSGLGFRFIHRDFRNAVLRIDYGIDVLQEGNSGFVLGLGQYF